MRSKRTGRHFTKWKEPHGLHLFHILAVALVIPAQHGTACPIRHTDVCDLKINQRAPQSSKCDIKREEAIFGLGMMIFYLGRILHACVCVCVRVFQISGPWG